MTHYTKQISFFSTIAFILCSLWLSGQTVRISDEVNIRNDYSYDLLGDINSNIVLFRDSGKKKYIDVFDEKLSHKYQRELRLEKDNVLFHGVIPFDTCFHMLYSYSEKDSVHTVLRKLDDTGATLDTVRLFTTEKKDKLLKFEMMSNNAKTHSLLYAYHKSEGFKFILLDHHRKKIIFTSIVEWEKIDFNDEFVSIDLSDDLYIFILLEQNNKKGEMEDHYFDLTVLDTKTKSQANQKILVSNQISIDAQGNYDPVNKQYVITGLYNEKSSAHSKGLFFSRSKLPLKEEFITAEFIPHSVSFLKEVYGRKKKKLENLEHHVIQDVLFNLDGGFVVFSEYAKTFTRKSSYQTYSQMGGRRGLGAWTDHHMEEIGILAISPAGELRWKNVLHKNQFSQDDGAAFSSFYLFSTPSILRIVFNEEIKNNNLVSEYLIATNGKSKRSSLLNTEYQNLKLRFREAIQLTNKAFLVPSEKSNLLKLVKISY